MSDATYEGLMASVARRVTRPVPTYAWAYGAEDQPRTLRANEYVKRNRMKNRVQQRALRRLKDRYPDEYRAIYQEERAREAASTKETA